MLKCERKWVDKALERRIPLNLSAISPILSSHTPAETQKAPAAPQSATTPTSHPVDTVTLSGAAQKASPAADVDHDGDSH
jgi:hypothetical protein